jgi:hypothetical protein
VGSAAERELDGSGSLDFIAHGRTGAAAAMTATMYFSFGKNARTGLSAKTTFDAVVTGERTSTTRFLAWPGAARYQRLNKGDLIQFFEDREMRGRSVVVAVDLVRQIDLGELDEVQLEAWSKAEGWSVSAARGFGAKYGRGVQVLYHVVGPLPALRETAPAEPAQSSLNFLGPSK